MNRMKYILVCLLFLLLWHTAAFAAQGGADAVDHDKVDVQEIVFGHIQDAYEWHIITWGEREVAIPLPIIVYHKTTGWHCFSSHHLLHGHAFEGFYIAAEGGYAGKVVYRDTDDKEVRPFDMSVTKTVASLFINCLLLVAIVLGVSRWYKRRKPEDPSPRGFIGFMEMFIMMVHDDVIKSCVGKDYKRYAPYLLTVFFFIFLNNLMGLIPIFPAGGNITGNISVTMTLALCTFLVVNIFGNKEYWKEILWPDVPTWLKVPLPLMPLIELFGIFTKPFALTVRLFANIMAGHAVILALTCIIFITAKMGPAMGGTMTAISVFFAILMNCLELLVAFIQAYVFTMLSAVFIGMSRAEAHHKEK